MNFVAFIQPIWFSTPNESSHWKYSTKFIINELVFGVLMNTLCKIVFEYKLISATAKLATRIYADANLVAHIEKQKPKSFPSNSFQMKCTKSAHF